MKEQQPMIAAQERRAMAEVGENPQAAAGKSPQAKAGENRRAAAGENPQAAAGEYPQAAADESHAATMKAIVYDRYGPPEVLRLAEIEVPTPKPNELLIKVHASSIGFGDLMVRRFGEVSPREFNMPLPMWLMGRMSFGFRKPKYGRLGHEFAGEVAAVGDEVDQFAPGDRVFGFLGDQMGADAEYAVITADGAVTSMPSNMSYEEAAVVPYGAFIALNLLRKASVRPGQKVLIVGASGGIGSAALQLAKHYSAEVTGVCGTQRMDFVRALGADHVIDYTAEDFTQNGQTYDLIFDVLGRSSFSQCKDSLTADGTYFLSSFKSRDLLDMLWTAIAARRPGRPHRKRVICALAIPERMEDLAEVRRLAEAGVLKAVIDRSFRLDQVAEAHRYVEAGRKRGHVAIAIRGNRRS